MAVNYIRQLKADLDRAYQQDRIKTTELNLAVSDYRTQLAEVSRLAQERDEANERLAELRARADAVSCIDHRELSFAAVCDSIDSKDLEGSVYEICMQHIWRADKSERESARLAQENERLREERDNLRIVAGQLRDSLVATEKTRDEYYAMLKAQTLRVQTMQAALRMVEWDEEGFCHWCRNEYPTRLTHGADCPRQLALGEEGR